MAELAKDRNALTSCAEPSHRQTKRCSGLIQVVERPPSVPPLPGGITTVCRTCSSVSGQGQAKAPRDGQDRAVSDRRSHQEPAQRIDDGVNNVLMQSPGYDAAAGRYDNELMHDLCENLFLRRHSLPAAPRLALTHAVTVDGPVPSLPAITRLLPGR